MTAADALFSLQRAFTDPGSQIAFVGPKIASLTAPNAHTVVIKLKSAWPCLLADLSGFNAAILPKRLIMKEGYATFLKHPVGTGPFMWSSASPGVSITVVRNPNYWEKGRPYLNSITFHVVPADTARAAATVGGQATLAQDPPLDQPANLKSNPSVRVYSFPSTLVALVALNVRKAPLNRHHVPGRPARAEARQLLKKSGVPLPIRLQIGVSQGLAQQAISTIMQADLAKIGIDLSALQQDFVTSAGGNHLVALSDVTLGVRVGEGLGVVGESGSGKTTLANCLAGLLTPSAGTVAYLGETLTAPGVSRRFPQVRGIQVVFQNAASSLNPRRTVGSVLTEIAKVHALRPKGELAPWLHELLSLVGLDSELAGRRSQRMR